MTKRAFSLEAMPLIGIAVSNLEAEVSRYERLFGITFHTFTAGVDYALHYDTDGSTDSSPALPANLRLAVDTSDMFELIELPNIPEGFRNIHYRVDNIDAATDHFVAEGLSVAQIIQAGNAREVVFDASTLNGIRMCLLEFSGPSFAEALAASPRSTTS